MQVTSLFLFSLLLLAWGVMADVYMQNPRGCNDRLNEEGDRQNAARLFDSENNARGGYCWGPPMSFVEGSILPIQWTAQHGCGGEHVTCTEIIQYMCSDANGDPASIIRDGTTTQTIPTDAGEAGKKENGVFVYGMNENLKYYQDCAARERNKGLFIADQNVGGRAINSRQNPNGGRSGYECTEERDYYPYWHPSPWKDIAVMVSTLDHCAFYQAESQNVKVKNYCKGATLNNNDANPNNERECNQKSGTWTAEPAHGIPPPECKLADFSRDNHLGNTLGGETANYTWILPNAAVEPCVKTGSCQCVLRIRYNVTTNESTGVTDEFKDSRNNRELKNNPTYVVEGGELTLALNTAQYGRTFQDRSFMFKIAPRPKGVSPNTKIYNLNVRGKRGNIVQTYPATEYDFTPNRLEIDEGDIIHYQWTGCDTNPGNAQGEGRDKTDRSNIVQIRNLDSNVPLVVSNETIENPMFESAYLRNRMALLGQTGCLTLKELKEANGNNINQVNQDLRNCGKLNAADPYFDGGLVKMNNTGTFYYTSTRNNNFSNRTQKGSLTVHQKKKKSTSGSSIAIGVLVTIGVVIVAAAGAIYYGKKNPHSTLGRAVDKLPRIPTERFFSSRSAAPAGSARREALLG